MANNEAKIAITGRYDPDIADQIKQEAEKKGCSQAEFVRQAVTSQLNNDQPNTEYIDHEQGQQILRTVNGTFTEISEIKTQLKRIGNNLNQEVHRNNRLEQIANSQRSMDIQSIIADYNNIENDCDRFDPSRLDNIMDRYEGISNRLAEELIMYTSTNPSKSVVATLRYLRGNGKGHNGNPHRNLLIDTIGMAPDEVVSLEKQMMAQFALRANKSTCVNECRRVLLSFSRNELDPDDPESAYIATEITKNCIKRKFPDRMAVVFCQSDGRSGLIHCHGVLAGVDSINHKGFNKEDTYYKNLERDFDAIASETITLDFGDACKDLYKQNVRRLRDQATDDEIDSSELSWMDDLKSRIATAAEESKSLDEFIEKMNEKRVRVKIINKGKENESLSYTLLEDPEDYNTNKVMKVREARLGTDYGIQRIREMIQRNIIKERETLRKATVDDITTALSNPSESVPVATNPVTTDDTNTNNKENNENTEKNYTNSPSANTNAPDEPEKKRVYVGSGKKLLEMRDAIDKKQANIVIQSSHDLER